MHTLLALPILVRASYWHQLLGERGSDSLRDLKLLTVLLLSYSIRSLGAGDLVSKVHTVGSVPCPLTGRPEQSLVESGALCSRRVLGAGC